MTTNIRDARIIMTLDFEEFDFEDFVDPDNNKMILLGFFLHNLRKKIRRGVSKRKHVYFITV